MLEPFGMPYILKFVKPIFQLDNTTEMLPQNMYDTTEIYVNISSTRIPHIVFHKMMWLLLGKRCKFAPVASVFTLIAVCKIKTKNDIEKK